MDAFRKMYNQMENRLIESGNAIKFDQPAHMNKTGEIIEDESLAFGRPVTIDFTPRGRKNTFLMDEMGDNTHRKSDSNKGGEKKVVPKGKIPLEEVGINDAHYTVAPFNVLDGHL